MPQVNFSRAVKAVAGTQSGKFGTIYNGAAIVYDLPARWLQILNNGTDGTSTNAKAIYVQVITATTTNNAGSDFGDIEPIISPLGSLMITGITNINQVRIRCVDGTTPYTVYAYAIN